MRDSGDDLRTRLQEQAEHCEGMVHNLEGYLSSKAPALADKVAEEVRSDIKLLKDLIAKLRQ